MVRDQGPGPANVSALLIFYANLRCVTLGWIILRVCNITYTLIVQGYIIPCDFIWCYVILTFMFLYTIILLCINHLDNGNKSYDINHIRNYKQQNNPKMIGKTFISKEVVSFCDYKPLLSFLKSIIINTIITKIINII